MATHVGLDCVSTGHQAKISQVPLVEFSTRRQRPVFTPAGVGQGQCQKPPAQVPFPSFQPWLLQVLTMPSYNRLPSMAVVVLRTLAIRNAFTLPGKKDSCVGTLNSGPGPTQGLEKGLFPCLGSNTLLLHQTMQAPCQVPTASQNPWRRQKPPTSEKVLTPTIAGGPPTSHYFPMPNQTSAQMPCR
jgi:hypothetical protein